MSDSTKKPDPTTDGESTESIDRARRRLLALGAYVPPTILGIVALQQAGCQPSGTCQPSLCDPQNHEPCPPEPCNPPPNPPCLPQP